MLIGLHLGNSIIKLKKENKIILNVFFILFAVVFEMNGFIQKQFIEKMTLQSLYPLYSDAYAITFFIDFIGILIMFMMIGYGIFNILKVKKKEKSEIKEQD